MCDEHRILPLVEAPATERADGIGTNVVLGSYDARVIESFLADPERRRVPPASGQHRPSEVVLERLLHVA
jgi:hypothetical protein